MEPPESFCHRFEQSPHLARSEWLRKRSLWLRPLIAVGIVLTGVVLAILLLRLNAGRSVALWEWLLGPLMGGWVVLGPLWLMRFGALRRRFLELRSDGVLLSEVGLLTYSSILSWDFSPQAQTPEMVWLEIGFADRIGQRARWSMLIDSRLQLEPIKSLLSSLELIRRGN